MINWDSMIWFVVPTLLLAGWGIWLSYHHASSLKVAVVMIAALLILGSFWVGLWLDLGYAPMQTLGETRLLYALFLLIIGVVTWLRTKYRVVLIFSVVLSGIFMLVDLLNPEIHQTQLMPILQSVWFVPHVTVYMFAYAMIGCAAILAVYGLFSKKSVISHCDTLVREGMALLTLGIVLGALWAQQAWGDYWAFDPKEVWAAVTWLIGVCYMHLRLYRNSKIVVAYIAILALFLAFQITWYGIEYLPTAAHSVHTYTVQ